MLQVHEGHCGLCTHFGEAHAATQQLIQIRTKHEAPENLIQKCGLPANASLDLKVTPNSGCSGFSRATELDA